MLHLEWADTEAQFKGGILLAIVKQMKRSLIYSITKFQLVVPKMITKFYSEHTKIESLIKLFFSTSYSA